MYTRINISLSSVFQQSVSMVCHICHCYSTEYSSIFDITIALITFNPHLILPIQLALLQPFIFLVRFSFSLNCIYNFGYVCLLVCCYCNVSRDLFVCFLSRRLRPHSLKCLLIANKAFIISEPVKTKDHKLGFIVMAYLYVHIYTHIHTYNIIYYMCLYRRHIDKYCQLQTCYNNNNEIINQYKLRNVRLSSSVVVVVGIRRGLQRLEWLGADIALLLEAQ